MAGSSAIDCGGGARTGRGPARCRLREIGNADCQHSRRELDGGSSAAERRTSRPCLPPSGGTPRNKGSCAKIESRRGKGMSAQEVRLKPDFRERAKANDVPVGRLIGFEAKDIADGRATVVLAAGPQHANPMGTLHGEFFATLLMPQWGWHLQ